jgi:transcriptional regulator with XRE-family HTH domain
MPAKTNEKALLIGSLVRAARDEAGLNNTTLSAATGLPRRSIVRIANGKNVPETATLELIGRATGKSLDYFLGRENGQRLNGTRIHDLLDDLVDELYAELRSKMLAGARP